MPSPSVFFHSGLPCRMSTTLLSSEKASATAFPAPKSWIVTAGLDEGVLGPSQR